MSTPDPHAPRRQPGAPDEPEPAPTTELPTPRVVEDDAPGAPIDPGQQGAADDYGTPSPPDRGAQHEFDPPPAAPPESEAFPWPVPGQPAPPAYQPPSPPPPPPYQSASPTAYPQSSPTPYPASGASQQPPLGFPPARPDGFGPPSGGYSAPQGSYPPYGYPPVDPYAKSRTVAGILGILLGGLGVHRFYLGYVGIGVLQIVVTVLTFGVGAIWGFVEGILYLTQRTGQFSVDATGRYLRE